MRESVTRSATVLLLLCAASARPAERPLNALTIPAGVEFVNVNVSVLNTKDRFVTDLGREDFVVLEDGVPQELALFAQKELPVSLVLLLDMSASMTANVRAVRSAAQRLISKLDPDDEVQVAQFNQGLRVLQAFTSDKHALDDAIRAAKPSGSTALHNSLYITLKDIMRDGPARDLRRRAIVLLSDGEDTASMVTDEQVMELARAAEINIYSIKIGVPGFDREAVGDQARYLLSALARESGGEAYFPNEVSRLAGIYDRIGQELHSQYSMGYVPSNTRFDGAWRQILVITARQGVTLRHRLGYYAANGSRRSSGETGSGHARSALLP